MGQRAIDERSGMFLCPCSEKIQRPGSVDSGDAAFAVHHGGFHVLFSVPRQVPAVVWYRKTIDVPLVELSELTSKAWVMTTTLVAMCWTTLSVTCSGIRVSDLASL